MARMYLLTPRELQSLRLSLRTQKNWERTYARSDDFKQGFNEAWRSFNYAVERWLRDIGCNEPPEG